MDLKEAYNRRKKSLEEQPFCFEEYNFEQLHEIYAEFSEPEDLLVFPEDYSEYPYSFLHTLLIDECTEKDAPVKLEGDQEFEDDDEAKIFKSDVHIEGHLDINTTTYILGDLIVNGLLFIDEYFPLFVAGKIKAKSIITYAPVYAGGTIEADDVICCQVSSHSYCVSMQKNIKTRLYIENKNTTHIEEYDATFGEISADHKYILHESDPEVNIKGAKMISELKDVLLDEVLKDTNKDLGFLNTKILLNSLKQGKSIWK